MGGGAYGEAYDKSRETSMVEQSQAKGTHVMSGFNKRSRRSRASAVTSLCIGTQ